MSEIYIVTTGSYDDYRVVSAWSSTEDADRHCMFLNAGSWYEDTEVEEYSLDAPFPDTMDEMVVGFKARYCFADSGFDVDVPKVEFAKAMFHPTNHTRVNVVGRHALYVFGASREECIKTLRDAVAEIKATREGLVL